MRKFFAVLFIGFLLAGPAKAADARYILLEKDGYVSVYEESNLAVPAIETNIAVPLLPDADQRGLTAGIFVEGSDALLCILEDFVS